MNAEDTAAKLLNEIDDYIVSYANKKTRSHTHESLLSWKDISMDERISMARRIDENDMSKILINDKGNIAGSMITTVLLLRLMGLNNTADRMEFLTHASLLHAQFKNTVEDIKLKDRLSKKNRKNAAGPKNKYYDEVIAIMVNTWKKYPLASKNGMKDKIVSHYGKDKISESSVKRWIKENSLGPQKEARPPVNFSLVIGS